VSEEIARRDRDLGDFIPGPSLGDYRDRFAGHFRLERHDGILTIRMHRDGRAARWSRGLLNAWNLLLAQVGADRDNEVVIISGTGDSWLAGVDELSFGQPVSQWDSDLVDEQYNDGVRVLERLVCDIDVPTIGIINGPGPRLELPLLCDLTLSAPDAVIGDGNFRAGPGRRISASARSRSPLRSRSPAECSYRALARVTPPSMTRVWPVIQEASSDSRNATAPATSPGTPRRLSG
jgi:hypothetical protein